jgi:cysteinyl-tRNA synthetase
MSLRLFNTMTRSVERFMPLAPPAVSLYTCGPTVYNYAHIGNFRTFLFEDLLRRWLETSGYRVYHIMNLTDVDDKTIKGAAAASVPLVEYTGSSRTPSSRTAVTSGCVRRTPTPRPPSSSRRWCGWWRGSWRRAWPIRGMTARSTSPSGAFRPMASFHASTLAS